MNDNQGSPNQEHNLPDLNSNEPVARVAVPNSTPSPFEQLATESIHTPGNNPDANPFQTANSNILNTDDTRNRFKKIAMGVFGILLLVGGVATGVTLVQREQDIRQKAASCSGTLESCENSICCEGFVCQGISGNRVCQQQMSGTCNTEGAMCGGNQGYIGFKCDQLTNNQCNEKPQTFDSFGEAAAYVGSCGQVDEIWVGGPCNKGLCGDFVIFDSGCTEEAEVKGISDQTMNMKGEKIAACGTSCGTTIGLCEPGFTCTYIAYSQCSVKGNPPTAVCIPPGIDTDNQGIITGTEYEGAEFERVRCGTETNSSNNSYISHPSFPDHQFTNEEVLEYICNPYFQLGIQ